MPPTVQLDRTPHPGSRRNRAGAAAPVGAEEEHRKANGVHYTPPLLAAYLAEQVANELKRSRTKFSELSILDPACGEGELLKAIVDAVPRGWRTRLRLTGFDMDEAALQRARSLLEDSGAAAVELHAGDFLSRVTGGVKNFS